VGKQVAVPTYKRFITGQIERFDERNTGYSRGDRGEIPGLKESFERGLKTKGQRNVPGFTREDYALNMAGRMIDTLVRRTVFSRDSLPTRWQIPLEPAPVSDPARMARKVKKVARWFGADLVGICELNPLWVYSHWGDHTAKLSQLAKTGDLLDVPKEYKYAIVMAFEMDYQDIQRSPAVTPAIDLGYAKMAFTAPSVAEFIRFLGFTAIPCGNDTVLSIPLAVDAGLGELGRHGLLITEEFGPRVRLAKVLTDLPLEADKPIDLGVQHFCENCEKCVDSCPSGAILKGARIDKPRDISNNSGILKWPIDVDNCLNWWAKNGTGCSNCIRSCTWNKPKGWLHELVRGVIRCTSLFDGFLVWADDILGYGKQVIRETPP
jgi:reductive dehalogenase